jgi:preprotein translocase subunit SecD
VISRMRWLPLILLVVLALSACSTPVATHTTSPASAAAIYLAVSKTCVEGSGPECVSVNGENVLVPGAFQRAGVTKVSFAEGDTQNEVNVTLSKDGTTVFHALTKKAAQAGNSARLVLKAGHEMLAADVVRQALTGSHVQIVFPRGGAAQKAADLIREG